MTELFPAQVEQKILETSNRIAKSAGEWFWLDDSGGRRVADPPVPVVDDVPF